MKFHFKALLAIVLLISFAFLLPSLKYSKVHFGQLGKQTFAAQMIESTAKGELDHGVFPTRHFVEVYEDGLVSWAEEVPLYSFMSASLVRTFGISPIQAGKTFSFISFLFIIFGFAQIAKRLGKPTWIFVMTAAIFPVFRLYSVQVMPDLCMTAALVWMIDSALGKKLGKAAFFLLIASLFKYYAVFAGFGLGLYWVYRRQWKGAFYLGLSIVPCILYVLWFMKLGIPNPITDSRIADGHGHMSSLELLFSLQDWKRVFLWWFVKNSSVPGSIIAALGAWALYRKSSVKISGSKDLVADVSAKPKNMGETRVTEVFTDSRAFFGFLWIGFFLFPLIFISSFYVHDYYGLQGSIGIALFAALGLSFLYEINELLAWPIAFVFLGFSVVTVKFMVKVMPDYEKIESAIEALHLPKNQFILSVSGISKPVISYHLGQDAYIIGVEEWTRPAAQARIKDPRFKFALLHDFVGDDGYFVPIRADLEKMGYKRLDLKLDLSETIFEAWSK